MVSDNLRSEVWHDFHDVTRLCRYNEARAIWYRKCHDYLLFGVVIFTFLSAVAGQIWPEISVSAIANLIAGGLAIFCLSLGFASKAALLVIVYNEFSILRYEYRDLWLKVEEDLIEDDEVLAKLKKLSQRIDEVQGKSDYAGISINKKENIKAGKKANEILQQQYHSNDNGNVVA